MIIIEKSTAPVMGAKVPTKDDAVSALLEWAQRQTQSYIANKSTCHSAGTEIVSLAANGDDDALTALVSLSLPVVRAKCPPELRNELEDVTQEVLMRIMSKFRSVESPFRASTYPAYLAYLKLTVRSVVINRLRKQKHAISLEELNELDGYEPSIPASTSAIDNRLLVESLLSLLRCPLEREAIARRYLLNESPAEIAEALDTESNPVTREDVYRLVERGLRRLSKHPYLTQY